MFVALEDNTSVFSMLYDAPKMVLTLLYTATHECEGHPMDVRFQRLARRQLSEVLAKYQAASTVPRPRDGWVSSIREALGMSVRQFAARLDIDPSGVVRLEKREAEESISLGSLRRAADALDCDLVYALVPRGVPSTSDESSLLDAVISERARSVAVDEAKLVQRTMALEQQSVRKERLEAQIDERTADLVRAPREIWSAALSTRSFSPSKSNRAKP
jgi:predicted DNA-binding mobile mystery protein A